MPGGRLWAWGHRGGPGVCAVRAAVGLGCGPVGPGLVFAGFRFGLLPVGPCGKLYALRFELFCSSFFAAS